MGIKSSIELIKRQDPSIKTGMEVILYPSFWAVGFHRVSHWLYLHKRFFLARVLSQFSRALTGIEIHPGASIGKDLFIDHGMGVVIGETCEIGDNVLIYQGVTLGGTGKGTGGKRRHPSIGNNVMIGAGVKILGPFHVGDNARIGAGSVVLQEVPDNCTVVGVPGRIVNRKEQPAADCLDQIRFPDPVSMELCKLRTRIEELEKRIGDESRGTV